MRATTLVHAVTLSRHPEPPAATLVFGASSHPLRPEQCVLPPSPPDGAGEQCVLPPSPPDGAGEQCMLPPSPPDGAGEQCILPPSPPDGAGEQCVLPPSPPDGAGKQCMLPPSPPDGAGEQCVLPPSPPDGAGEQCVLPPSPPDGAGEQCVLPPSPPDGAGEDEFASPPRLCDDENTFLSRQIAVNDDFEGACPNRHHVSPHVVNIEERSSDEVEVFSAGGLEHAESPLAVSLPFNVHQRTYITTQPRWGDSTPAPPAGTNCKQDPVTRPSQMCAVHYKEECVRRH